MTRSPVQAQDHVLSERKRREKLNRHFINMSSLLPNLKKMDKASVLEDAVSYIRELQDRVKELEGITSVVKEKDSNKCVIGFKRCRVGKGNGNDNTDESSSNETQSAYKARESSSEIDVRMLGSNVLVTMYLPTNSTCVLVEAISKMQKLGLSIISTSATPFATTTTLITIVAQIEDDKFMTAKDLVRNLQLVV
ncbi:transcription factor NAI1-like [Rutidosis leptorrhynchoides]|uniref:transcription factor NAI1-like n=1 Tax=Rutidosis leptorrhynchoides TaxID=125765 RepID=UPI003A9A06C8